MKEISHENEKDSKNVEERSRFASNKKKVKIIKKIKELKKMQKIIFLFARKRAFNKSRIIDI
jgi:hypothetical protein